MLRENIVVGEGTKYPLKGMLTLPKNAEGPVPAVVFVHGSGSSNMDEKVYKLTPFRDLAEGLARHGIASIRYDKRSHAHGWKMLRDKSQPITVRQETIEDAILATELLKQDDRIDSEKVFIVGHSMGAMLAPRIDAEGGDYRGLIMMAGTPRRLELIMEEQLEDSFAEMGKFVRFFAEKSGRKILKKFDGIYEMPDEEAMKLKIGGGTTVYYFKEMGDPLVSCYLEKTQKPMLIMQGEKDCQVKVEKDFNAYKEILAGRDDVTFKLYENLNHAFVPAIYHSILKVKQEFSVERHIGEDVISDIANWIKEK